MKMIFTHSKFLTFCSGVIICLTSFPEDFILILFSLLFRLSLLKLLSHVPNLLWLELNHFYLNYLALLEMMILLRVVAYLSSFPLSCTLVALFKLIHYSFDDCWIDFEDGWQNMNFVTITKRLNDIFRLTVAHWHDNWTDIKRF